MFDRMPLRGLTALVTGAASGIGRQIAVDLWTREGCGLRLADRDAAGLAALEADLRREGDPRALTTHVVDIGSEEAVSALAASLDDAPLDILVNCAGILCVGPFERTPMAEFERVVGVNFLGTVRMTRALLPRLLASKRGFVVNVASAAGLVGSPGMAAYSASKFGVVGFSEALRAELAGRVGVCAVCPTLIRTNIVTRASVAGAGDSDARRAEMEATFHRFSASPERVSRAVVRAIARGKRLVLVNPDAHLLYYMHRLAPGLTALIVRWVYRRLIAKGVLHA